MGLVRFSEEDADHPVTAKYSTGRGSVLRGKTIEVTRISWEEGGGGQTHSHPEEQFFYILSGRLQVNLDGEEYEVGPGEGSFHPSNVPHSNVALEPTTALSFKGLVDPQYEATGELT